MSVAGALTAAPAETREKLGTGNGALVPRPRAHLVTYRGMFAPAAPLRDRVVQPPPPEDDVAQMANCASTSAACAHPPTVPPTATRKRTSHKRHRYSWAELLRRAWANTSPVTAAGSPPRSGPACCRPRTVYRIALAAAFSLAGCPAGPEPGRHPGRDYSVIDGRGSEGGGEEIAQLEALCANRRARRACPRTAPAMRWPTTAPPAARAAGRRRAS